MLLIHDVELVLVEELPELLMAHAFVGVGVAHVEHDALKELGVLRQFQPSVGLHFVLIVVELAGWVVVNAVHVLEEASSHHCHPHCEHL